ncbi:SIS domain-containing protein [Candidatus Poribacteria bacterium]|nr:SIS domain-containing protein [Candidatus Poribacteria bacterium]
MTVYCSRRKILKNKKFINKYFDQLKNIIDTIDRDKIDQAIELLLETWRNGNTIYVMGNGGSASTASHMVCDLAKVTIAEGKERMKVMGLTDNAGLISAWTNDSGFGTIFVEQLRPFIKKDDVLIGVSVHGGSGEGEAGPWSQNLVQAMKLAKDRKAKIIGFSGFDGGEMAKMSDVCMVVPIDTEPLGTPLVEAFHVVLHHLIAVSLRLRIQES